LGAALQADGDVRCNGLKQRSLSWERAAKLNIVAVNKLLRMFYGLGIVVADQWNRPLKVAA
jgi:hypothetical protein